MFAYCGNNPVSLVDSSGTSYSPVGGGIQFEVNFGHTVVGFEVIIYWDVKECENGAPVIAFYAYGGVSLNTTDALQASILAFIADNTDLLENGTANLPVLIDGLIALLTNQFSISASGVLIMGNEEFISINSYLGEFTSIGGAVGYGQGSIAYSSTCYTIAAGGTLRGANLFPSWGVSKTWYEKIGYFSLGTTTPTVHHRNSKRKGDIYECMAI